METIQKLITDSVNKHRHNRALWVNDRYYSYDELNFYSDKYIEVLSRYQNQNVCILLEKNIFCYGAILALFKDGRTYVPLNIKYSDYRNTQIVNHSKAQVLITEKRFASKVARIISPENRSSTEVIFSEDCFKSSHNDYSSSRDKHVETPQVDIFKNHKKDYICYLLFTSGTTGEPKGVPISSNNLVSYLENISLQYVINQSDRLTQHFDLTFDLSVHDIFVSWINGSCLYVCPNRGTINPTFFVRKHKITIWFSVPSLGVYMQKMKQLKGNVFPSLRQTFFCGEALPVSLVKQWLLAAPNSKIYNLYGPTESTIAILNYKWEDDTSENECVNGIVPIGKPFRGQSAKIIEGDSYKKKTANYT